MKKKNEVTLYDGGLMFLVIVVCILVLVGVGKITYEEKRKWEEIFTAERIAIPDYSDDELITNYYQIDAELQGALDDLESARGQATRYSLEQRKKTSEGGFGEGFARTYNPGVANERFIKIKVDTLRQIIALYLAEIAKRGIKLPG